MKKILPIIFLLSFLSANAFEIVYPKSSNVKINSDKTFFIGNEKSDTLKINGVNVKLHSSGGFKHLVNLTEGENKFIIDNGKNQKIYKIIRPNKKNYNDEKQIIDYELPLDIVTTRNQVPLRSTPVNKGLNRLSHLEINTQLQAVSEYGEFYKVQLARDDFGWVAKSDVIQLKDDYIPSIILKTDYEDNSEDEIFKFTTDNKKIPYVLAENKSGFDLFLYGLNDNIIPYGKYEFPIAHDGKNFGYSSFYNKENELVIKIRKYNPSIKDLRITIDPGHGGSESGAIGCLGDKEKDINLKIALKLKEKLEAIGAQVFMTRKTDKNLGLQDRVDFTNQNDSQIFISIHNNAVPDEMADKDITGTEVYYFYPQAKELARHVANGISTATGLKNNGIKGESFAVIRNTNAVSILIEAAYMITPEDNAKLQNNDFLDKIADGIFNGLENYLK